MVRQLALVGGVVGFGAYRALRGIADAGDRIAKTADKLGIGVEALQELRFAGDRAGVEVRTLEMALQRFTRRAAEAAAGTGEARDAIRYLGLDLRDSTGRIRPTEELFADVADKMLGIEDQALRLRIAFKLFDSEGVKVVNMLQGGSTWLREMAAEARALGFVISEQTIRNTEKLHDGLGDLAAIAKGITFELAAELVPAVRELSQEVLGWWKANRQAVLPEVVTFAKELALGFRQLVGFVRDVGPPTWAFVQAIGGLRTVLAGISIALLAPLITSLAAVAVAIWPVVAAVGALGMALLLTPVGIFTMLAAAAVGAALLIRKYWEPLTEWLSGVWGGIKGFFGLGAAAGATVDRGPGAAQRTADVGALAATAPAIPQARVGGKLLVEVQDKRVRAAVLEADSPDFDIDVDAGVSMVPVAG
jgi:hypothetical protein